MIDAATGRAIGAQIASAGRILVITHVAPDGDALGSLTGTGLILQQLGKEFSLVCDDGLLPRFRYLPLSGHVRYAPDSRQRYDLVIAVDAGDQERMGQAYAGLPEPKPPIVNIDHHITNTRFGRLNLVCEDCNATAEVLFHLLPFLDVALTRDLAICLLTGLVTDTLSFRTAGVTGATLAVASALVEAGADMFTITTLALNLKELSTLLIWQKGLSNMKVEDGLLWTTISDAERTETGHRGGSSFGLGNMMADVYEAAMSAVLLEQSDGRVSVGFRCRPPYSVAELAQSLGGGGHHLAAGCMLDGPLHEAEALVVARCLESIQQQQASNGEQMTAHRWDRI